jgi:CheY-like chemotaxis protein
VPHLLLVDDSEAILTYERAALSSHYQISTAVHGVEALEKIAAIKPDLVVLDLSMPVMDGEEVLRRCRADPRYARLPFIIVSAEHERAKQCLALGADAVLPKPIRAKDLAALVARVLESTLARVRDQALVVLDVRVGPVRLGIPLESVRIVLPQPATRPIVVGPMYLREMFELEGEPVCVLDLALRLGVEYAQPLLERKLVVLSLEGGTSIALNVDDVHDPLEIPEAGVLSRERLAGGAHEPLAHVLLAIAHTDDGLLPVIDPGALLSAERLRALSRALREPLPGELPR